MPQFGANRMGGVALVAGSDVTQDLRNVSKGPVSSIYVSLKFSLISTAAGFNTSVGTEQNAAAEGVDDLDIITGALISRVSMSLDPSTYMFNLTVPQLRTVLGLLNQKDFGGNFLTGSAIPATGGTPKAFTVSIKIPISLSNYFRDGNIFVNGSRRVANGSITFTSGTTLTPTVVLANGSAAVSAVAVTLSSETGSGTENDVGMTWRVNRIANLPTIHELPASDAGRLGLLHATPAWTSPVTAWRVEDLDMLSPVEFANRYQGDRLLYGGFDITQRVTPLLFVERDRTFMDFLAHVGKEVSFDAVSGASSVTIYDILAESISPQMVQQISTEVGGGGAVSLARPNPASVTPGVPLPPALEHMLPVRILPGRVSDGGTGAIAKKSSPADAAASTLQSKIRARSMGAIFRNLRPR